MKRQLRWLALALRDYLNCPRHGIGCTVGGTYAPAEYCCCADWHRFWKRRRRYDWGFPKDEDW